MDMSDPKVSAMAPILQGKIEEVPDDKAPRKIGFARVPTPKMSQGRELKSLSAAENVQLKKNLPAHYKLKRYYLPSEVAVHETADNCWVSLFNQVFDLTRLIAENHESPLCDPIVLAAGQDITHWFHPDTREPKKFVDPKSGLEEYYCPTGRYLHIPPSSAQSDSVTEVKKFDIPWWQDIDSYMIGRLTKKERKINIMNTLCKGDEEVISVASEETLNEILDRYLQYNVHAASYTWKRLGKKLDMDLTLVENGIADETQECLNLGIDPEEYIPTIHLYFDDDLTIQ